VAIEVATCAVIVLGGPGVGMSGKDLGVPERDTGVEGVGDRGVPQRVRADTPRDPGDLWRLGGRIRAHERDRIEPAWRAVGIAGLALGRVPSTN
jgi:hypothetical protein